MVNNQMLPPAHNHLKYNGLQGTEFCHQRELEADPCSVKLLTNIWITALQRMQLSYGETPDPQKVGANKCMSCSATKLVM